MPNNWSKSCRYKSAESMLNQKRLLMSQKFQIITNRLLDNKQSSKFKLIGEVFFGANYWSPIITSKNSLEILSNVFFYDYWEFLRNFVTLTTFSESALTQQTCSCMILTNYLASTASPRLYLVLSGCICSYLFVSGCIWLYLFVSGRICLYLLVSACICSYLLVSGCI